MKKYAIATLLFLCWAGRAQLNDPQARIEAYISDENGSVISNAFVRIGFFKLKTSNPWDGQENVISSGLSNEKGFFGATHRTLGSCSVEARATNYYLGFGGVDLNNHNGGKWLPWPTLVELKLRKKVNPTALYAKKFASLQLPGTNSPIGYDLLMGDCVTPHGTGLIADLQIKLERDYRSNLDYEWKLTVEAAGTNNGFCAILPEQKSKQSELRFPRMAPESGYSTNQIAVGLKYGKGVNREYNSAPSSDFFFRVRTELDERGQVKQALYGKLIGPIQVSIHYVKTGKLNLTYYLNPSFLDRNLEFDPKKNLFKNLKSLEQVTAP